MGMSLQFFSCLAGPINDPAKSLRPHPEGTRLRTQIQMRSLVSKSGFSRGHADKNLLGRAWGHANDLIADAHNVCAAEWLLRDELDRGPGQKS